MAVFKKKDNATDEQIQSEAIAGDTKKTGRQRRTLKDYDASLNISPQKGAVQTRKRVGRGQGSGLGKTCGRGQKGQNSRSGGGVKIGFEGGQMPLQRRIPKRGFVNIFATKFNLISLNDIVQIKDLPAKVDKDFLMKQGLLKNKKLPIKFVGKAKMGKAIEFEINKISAGAKQSIEEAGGKVVEIEIEKKLTKGLKKEKIDKKPRKEKKLNKLMARIIE